MIKKKTRGGENIVTAKLHTTIAELEHDCLSPLVIKYTPPPLSYPSPSFPTATAQMYTNTHNYDDVPPFNNTGGGGGGGSSYVMSTTVTTTVTPSHPYPPPLVSASFFTLSSPPSRTATKINPYTTHNDNMITHIIVDIGTAHLPSSYSFMYFIVYQDEQRGGRTHASSLHHYTTTHSVRAARGGGGGGGVKKNRRGGGGGYIHASIMHYGRQ